MHGNAAVIGRMGMAGKLFAVGEVTLKLEALAEKGKADGVVMHVLISPEHLDDDNVPIEASGAPVLLPKDLWTHLAFYRVADSETMLKILLHPADARGASCGDGGGVAGFGERHACRFSIGLSQNCLTPHLLHQYVKPHTPTFLPPGPPPGLDDEDEPYELPPVVNHHLEGDPWQDLAPVRTAFAPAHNGFYVLHDVEPAILTYETLGPHSNLNQEMRNISVHVLADCVVRGSVVVVVDAACGRWQPVGSLSSTQFLLTFTLLLSHTHSSSPLRLASRCWRPHR